MRKAISNVDNALNNSSMLEVEKIREQAKSPQDEQKKNKDQVSALEDDVEAARSTLIRLRGQVQSEKLAADVTTVRLFQDAKGIKLIEDDLPIGKDAPKHQEIAGEATVLGSIRLLAETVRDFHNGPAILDATGKNFSLANARLFKAVRTVSGHILMLSLNEHLSEENVIRLRMEIAAHGLHLDAYESRLNEAGFRLTLNDIQAYHRSGITDADIKSTYGALESAFLGWIAKKR